MEPIAIEKVMMTLSILLTTPENYIQLNSRDVNVSSLMRIGGDVRIYFTSTIQNTKAENSDNFFLLYSSW